uniref:Nuclear receptor domain-containing protein n=1 Tax=Caenorhabditis tropicalis TaxID=1561998 RepID=A0A1I7V050_9PELO
MNCSDSAEIKICLVCDITSKINYHFGSTTCLACASFFRRTVSLGIHYICNKDGNCSASHVIRSGCRSCRFKKCNAAGMKAGLVRGKRDVSKMPKYVRDSVQQGNDVVLRDYATLTVETLRGCSSKPNESEDNGIEEKEINTLLNVTTDQLMQYYIDLNNKSFLPISRICSYSFYELNRKNNQEATGICQNCPGTDLLDLMDLGILFKYVSFANLWLDGLWAEIQINKFENSAIDENEYNDMRNSFKMFICDFKMNVGKSLEHLNLDLIEYAALKSFCIWKLGILDFGTTLKIFAQEHYLGVTEALNQYYEEQKNMNQEESALRIANMTLLLGPIFNSYQDLMKLHQNFSEKIQFGIEGNQSDLIF